MSTRRQRQDSGGVVQARVFGGTRLVSMGKADNGGNSREFGAEDGTMQVTRSGLIANEPARGRLFDNAGIVPPPYDPASLIDTCEKSAILRPCVDAMAVNIDGFGCRLVPVLDMASQDAAQDVKAALHRRGVEQAVLGGGEFGDVPEPSDAEVEEQLKRLRLQADLEWYKLDTFFRSCCSESSFVALRQKTRVDLEITGNGFWEVLRNGIGEISRFVYAPASTVRLRPLEADSVPVTERERITVLDWREVQVQRRFRTFCQDVGGKLAYFKQLGDPRVVSRMTGKIYADVAAFTADRDKPEGDVPATEMIHFGIFSPRTPYGVPRWIGALLEILGSRLAAEINLLYFNNKAIPAMAILVSGGTLSRGTVKRIEDYIESHVKGVQNFHAILVLEAQAQPDAQGKLVAPVVTIQPLTAAQQKDGLFLEYDKRNRDNVAQTFRLPRLLIGNTADFNRATAEASLVFAEQQVFRGIREEFDWVMDKAVLAAHGAKFWEFQSVGPSMTDTTALATTINELAKTGVVTPAEARRLLGDALGESLDPVDQAWAQAPLPLTLAGIPVEAPLGRPAMPGPPDGATGPSVGGDGALAEGTTNVLATLAELRGKLSAHGRAALTSEFHARAQASGIKVIHVPADVLAGEAETPVQ